MKTFDGFLKRKLGDTNVLLAGGDHKALSDFIGSISYDSSTRKIKYTPVGGSATDLVTFGTLAFDSTSYLPLSGGTMTGPLKWTDNNALPERSSVEYVLSIDPFASGGKTYWSTIATLKSSLGLGSNAYSSTSYLPLTGGTLTGLLSVQNIGNTSTGLYDQGAMQIREYNYGGALEDTWGNAPRLTWHWGGRVAAQIGLASNGWLYEAPLTATNFYRIVVEGSTEINWGINISGNADTVDGYHASSFVLSYHNANSNPNIDSFTDLPYILSVADTGSYGAGTKAEGSHNGFGVLHIHTHSGNYFSQLGLDTNQNRLWMRSANNTSSFGSWNKVAYTSDIPSTISWSNVTGKPFNWSGQSGQPSWLWGSNDGTNYYVWNPSNFSVNYATSAGTASTANGLWFSNDGTLKLYSVSGGGCPACGTETVCLQSCFDGQDGSSHSYVINYTSRCVIALQPRGGYVGVNTTVPSYPLHVNGNVGASNYYSSSDINKKENIKRICPILPLYSFNWKESKEKSYGFIAQYLEDLGYTELVNGEEGNKSVNYSAALSWAMAVLSNVVDDLRGRIIQLENKLSKYENL